MATARQLCIDSLRTSGAVAGLQVPTADEIDLSLRQLNSLLSGWALESWWVPSTAKLDITFPTGVRVIKIGSFAVPESDEVNALVPDIIDQAYRVDGDSSYRLDNKQYLNLTSQAEGAPSGDACAFAYQRINATYGELTIDREPQGSTIIRIYYNVVIPSYELDDEITLPPAYTACLEYALAGLLATQFGIDGSKVESIAASRLERIRMHNIKVPDMKSDFMGSGVYDIYTDSFV